MLDGELEEVELGGTKEEREEDWERLIYHWPLYNPDSREIEEIVWRDSIEGIVR